MISVSFCKVTLEINISRVCDVIPSSSAYNFIPSPVSCLLTTVFLKNAEKILFLTQKFGYTNVVLSLAKLFSILHLFYKLIICQATSVRNFFSYLLFNTSSWRVESPPLTLPEFREVHSSQPTAVSFLATAFEMFFSEGWMYFLTRTKVIKADHCFEDSVAMNSKSNNTERVVFLLCPSNVETFNFTFWSCSMEVELDHFFEATGLALSRQESIRHWIKIPTHIMTCRHGLTHRVVV